MALKDNASLALIPAAYKTSKIYSAIPTDGDGDFTFTRSGSATRVNKAGLVETMGTNIGRLNYDLTNGTPASCPSLLLEPSRKNEVKYSEDFSSGWDGVRGTITTNTTETTAPNGSNNAVKFEKTESGNESYFRRTDISVASVGTYSVSFFAKRNNTQFTHFLLFDGGSNGVRGWFNIENGTIGGTTTFGSTFTVSDLAIEEHPNGWYRCSAKVVVTGSDTTWTFRLAPSNSNTNVNSTDGDIVYWAFPQVEQGSHKTSYIPTSGSAVTRTADDWENTDGITVTGDFTFFVHLKNFENKTLGNFPFQVFLREASSPFSYFRFLLEGNERFFAQLRDNNTSTTVFNRSGDTLSNLGDDIKLAFAKSGTNCKYYENGSLIASLTITDFNYSFNRINHTTGNDQGTRIKEVMVFEEQLTDTQLIELTS